MCEDRDIDKDSVVHLGATSAVMHELRRCLSCSLHASQHHHSDSVHGDLPCFESCTCPMRASVDGPCRPTVPFTMWHGLESVSFSSTYTRFTLGNVICKWTSGCWRVSVKAYHLRRVSNLFLRVIQLPCLFDVVYQGQTLEVSSHPLLT